MAVRLYPHSHDTLIYDAGLDPQGNPAHIHLPLSWVIITPNVPHLTLTPDQTTVTTDPNSTPPGLQSATCLAEYTGGDATGGDVTVQIEITNTAPDGDTASAFVTVTLTEEDFDPTSTGDSASAGPVVAD